MRGMLATFRLLPMLLLCAGCEAMGTFVNETGDLASGRTQQAVERSQQAENSQRATNVSLRTQLAGAAAERRRLDGQLADARARLDRINARLAADRNATEAERDQYRGLTEKQAELQQRLAALSAAPPPNNQADAAAEKAELDRLAAQRNALARQVDALQRAL